VVRLLREEGHYVKGVDLNLYEDSRFDPIMLPDESVIADEFDLTERDLEGFDAVVHLAGISNDPIGAFAPELTWRVNLDGSMHVARKAKAAGVPRFVFSSSCSIYGKSGDKVLGEDDEIAPITDYGRTKIDGERALSALADEHFSPVYLRNATAYGASPRLRLDLVVNNLCAWAYATGEVRIISDGTPWRPLVHCEDIARACVFLAQAPKEKIHDQAFNIGMTAENYQVRDIVDLVIEAVPGSKAVYTGEGSPDNRDYRVDFTKFASSFPDCRFEWTAERGVDELADAYSREELTLERFQGPSYIRLGQLKRLLSAGELDDQLRRRVTLSS
jgi:nucleoside-diphosphate-sugar epimerase